MSAARPRCVAVVGAGWAGCAAAVELTLRGCRVHLFESSKILGGRARRLRLPDAVQTPGERTGEWTNDSHHDWEAQLDNGQHILLGTYAHSLRLMRAVGVSISDALLRLPLQMRYPPGTGGMDFLSAKLPAPLHLAVPLLRTPGLSIADKLSLVRFASAARWMDWRLNQDCSVAALLEIHQQTARVIDLLWRPLCLAALNTPLDRASAQVFLTVLRESLGARRAASDMLIPRTDLSALFPTPAAAFIEKHGGRVMYGARVSAITRVTGVMPVIEGNPPAIKNQADGWQLQLVDDTRQQDRQQCIHYDNVILATPIADTARLLASAMRVSNTNADDAEAGDTNASSIDANYPDVSEMLDEMEYEPIITCYLQYPSSLRLALPFYALQDSPSLQRWGQFVFDRGHLDATQAGLLAVVISAASDAVDLSQEALCAAVADQLAAAFHNPALGAPQRVKRICEKRATFACTPGLRRPGLETSIAGIVRAGDYVSIDEIDESQTRTGKKQDYPATIEAAVRSGVRAAAYLCQ